VDKAARVDGVCAIRVVVGQFDCVREDVMQVAEVVGKLI
jgi:hypothetical protein